jgi:hypothetical protein
MVNRIQHLGVTQTSEMSILSMRFGAGHRIDPLAHFAAAIRHDADPFDAAAALERLAGEIRCAARGGVLK